MEKLQIINAPVSMTTVSLSEVTANHIRVASIMFVSHGNAAMLQLRYVTFAFYNIKTFPGSIFSY